MLYQSAEIERAGHRSKCALRDPQSTFWSGEPLFKRTASNGKAVEANHHRLFPRVSMLRGSRRLLGLKPRVEEGLFIFPLDILLLLSLVLNLFSALVDGIIEARIIHCGSCLCPRQG